jgi:hypothetical protein
LRIRIDLHADPVPDPGFETQRLKKFTTGNFFSFFFSEMQYTYPLASIKDIYAIGEAFSPQKRTSRISKHAIALLDPDSKSSRPKS